MSLQNNPQLLTQPQTTMESTHFNSYSFTGQPFPEGNHTLTEQINGGYHHHKQNQFSGGGTYDSSAQQINDVPMDTTTSGSLSKQESTQRLREELQSHAKDEPKSYIRDEPETPITDNKYITVLIRGEGSNMKAVQIKQTDLLDEFITEVNNASGLGSNGNTHLVFNGNELFRGTGQTVEQVGIRDTSIVQNLLSGGGTYTSSAQNIKDKVMDTTTPRQESAKTTREEFQSHIKDERKPSIKVGPKTTIEDNKFITVSIRGQGKQPKPLRIKRTASLDVFISEVNSLFGFGPKARDTYVVFEGKQLSRGTQTVEQAGIRDKSNVELCMQTYGG